MDPLANKSGGRIVYQRDQLIALSKPTLLPRLELQIPDELKRRRRGCRAGAARKARRRRYKPVLPNIVMGNVRSLANKMDELCALTLTQREYRECSIMCFTETWLQEHFTDANSTVPGFLTVRADRDHRQCGKKRGGGIALFINNRWCNPGHVTIKERLCSPDIELLAVSCRPYYLPREFTCVICITVYIPPSAATEEACDVISTVTARLQTKSPSALIVISGDFNHTSLSKTLPNFQQFVRCPTRGSKTLDLFYANVNDAYSSTALPPVGRSDHNLVHLSSSYIPIVKQRSASLRTVRRWSQETNEALQGCFEAAQWDVLCEPHGDDINSMTDCVTDYINFCVDNIIPSKTVKCFPNNKPWISSDLKELLNKKKRAFREGDREKLRSVQREVKVRLREGRDAYRRKLENKLQQNNMREVWSGMKKITGLKARGEQAEGTLNRANEINNFFNRFCTGLSASPPPAPSHTVPRVSLPPQPSCLTSRAKTTDPHYAPPSPQPPSMDLESTPEPTGPPPTPATRLYVTSSQVKRQLEKLRQSKAAGPDGICPRVLKTCAEQLCGILQHLYNLSLSQEKVPVLWKTSCLVPVPKKPSPSVLNDYRPVALTPHVMKVLERLMLAHLRPQVCSLLDPLQFAYRPRVGVDDAIIYLLQRAHSHLNTAGSTVRIMFFDFSSAFNTIQPALLRGKLQEMQVDASTTSWIIDYLTDRPQFVRLKGCVSDRVVSSTGAPQGTVLSPFLFTLYTSDFQHNSESCFLQKFSDDSVVVGCIRGGDDTEYRDVVDRFVSWSADNNLLLNVSKTREMVVDFGRKRMEPNLISIGGEVVARVDCYKYLGVHLDNRLDWKRNTEAVFRKGLSRLYFLRRLRSFNVCRKMLRVFYQSVVASAIFFAAICWGGGVSAADSKKLNKLIKKAGSVIGTTLEPLEPIVESRMLQKLLDIMDDSTHPLHNTLAEQRSVFSRRLRQLPCSKDRYRRYFVPTAITIYNNSTIK